LTAFKITQKRPQSSFEQKIHIPQERAKMAAQGTANQLLNGPNDWYPWYKSLVLIATTAQIWEYLDPEADDGKIPKLVDPEEPDFNDAYAADAEAK
jgi:hypothetical protein